MLFEQGLSNLSLLKFWLSRLIELRGSSPRADIDLAINRVTGQPVNSNYFAASVANVAFYYGQSGAYTVVLFDGVATAAQGSQLADGYSGVMSEGASNPSNSWYTAQPRIITDLISSRHFAAPQFVLMAGYSAGGAVAQVYAKRLVDAGIGFVPPVTTFGSPAAGNGELQSTFAGGNLIRIMNDDDPIPLLSSQVSSLALLSAGMSGRAVSRWANFVQGVGGVNVDAGGNFSNSNYPVRASASPTYNLGAWLLGLDSGIVTAHTLSEYLRRLNLRDEAVLHDDRVPFVPVPVDRPNPPSPSNLTEANRAYVRTIFHTGVVQNAQPVQIPAIKEFDAIRLNSVWYVTLGGEFIAVGPTKKRARGIARVGNEFLRRLQVLAVVDPAVVQTMLAEYFASATDPLGGYVPVMNTQVPAIIPE